MSSIKQKETIVLDERINVAAPSSNTNVVHIGPAQVQFSTTSSSGNSFASQIQFSSVAIPSNVILSKDMKVSYSMSVAFPSNGPNETYPDYVMPTPYAPPNGWEPTMFLKSFPLSSQTNSMQLTLNSQVISQDLKNVLAPVSRCFSRDFMREAATLAPAQLDNLAQLQPGLSVIDGHWHAAAFTDGAEATAILSNGALARFTIPDAWPAIGSKTLMTIDQLPGLTAYWLSDTAAFTANRPYRIYVQSPPQVSGQPTDSYLASPEGDSRGSFRAMSFQQNYQDPDLPPLTDGYTKYTFQVTEPVIAGVLSLDDNSVGLANITTLSLSYQYSNLKSVLVAAGICKPIDYTSMFVSITAQPSAPVLSLKFLSVDSDIISIPKMQMTNYEQTQFFVNQTSTLELSNDAIQYQTISSPSYILNSMPSLLYIYCRIAQGVTESPITQNSSGKFAQTFVGIGQANPITNPFQCTINNKSGCLASCTLYDVYTVSKSNGYKYSYATWKMSPVIIISPSRDIGLSVSQGSTLPGEPAKVTFSYTMTMNSAPYWYTAPTSAARQLLGVPSGVTPIECCLVSVLGCGTMTTGQGIAQVNDGELTETEVKALMKAPHHTIVSSEDVDVGGGMFNAKTPRRLAGTASK